MESKEKKTEMENLKEILFRKSAEAHVKWQEADHKAAETFGDFVDRKAALDTACAIYAIIEEAELLDEYTSYMERSTEHDAW